MSKVEKLHKGDEAVEALVTALNGLLLDLALILDILQESDLDELIRRAGRLGSLRLDFLRDLFGGEAR